jgi:hypothetical protein
MYIVLKTKQFLPHSSHLKKRPQNTRNTAFTAFPFTATAFILRLRFPLRFSPLCPRLLKLRFLLRHSYRGTLRGSFIVTAVHSVCSAPPSPPSLV